MCSAIIEKLNCWAHDGQQDDIHQQGYSDTNPNAPVIRLPDKISNPKPKAFDVFRRTGLLSHSSRISEYSKRKTSPALLVFQGSPDTAEIIRLLPQNIKGKL